MGKKKTSGQAHATKSFDQLVAETARNVVKPFIFEVFGVLAERLSRNVAQQQVEMKTRLIAIEDVLKAKMGITDDEIQTAISDIEDSSTGYVKVSRPAVAGDLLRVSLRTRYSGQADWSDIQRRQISNLMNVGMPANVPLSLGTATVESSLIGMASGENKVVILDEGTDTEAELELFVERVSEKVKKAEATNENPNA